MTPNQDGRKARPMPVENPAMETTQAGRREIAHEINVWLPNYALPFWGAWQRDFDKLLAEIERLRSPAPGREEVEGLETTEAQRARAAERWPVLSGYDDDGPIIEPGFWLLLLRDFERQSSTIAWGSAFWGLSHHAWASK